MKLITTVLLFVILVAMQALPQSYRSSMDKGAELYKEKKYGEAEVQYRKASEVNKADAAPHFNLANSYFKQKKYDEALNSYNQALGKSKTEVEKSEVLYNIGNTYLAQEKFKESIEYYKQALAKNPKDENAKYNLSYAIKKQKEKENQQKKNDQNKDDQNKDKNDQNKDDQKNNDKKNDENKQNQQDQNKNDQNKDKDNTKQSKQPKISKQDAQRILDALKNNEKDLQKKLRKQQATGSNPEKDW